MPTATSKPLYRNRWWMPVFSLFLGALMLVAFWIGDSITEGLVSFGIMAALAAASWSSAAARPSAGSAAPAATSAGRRSTSTPPRSPARC